MSCFGTPFANERVNEFQTLQQSARHHYYPLFSSIRGKLSFKKSPSVWYEILRLFVNPLNADDKYCDSNMQNFSQQCQTPLSQKKKTLSGFFIAFLKCASKKRWLSYPNHFRNYRCWKTWLLKPLKGLASEHHSLMNVLTGSKHCWIQHGTTVTLFSRQFEVNWVGKCHLQSDMKP